MPESSFILEDRRSRHPPLQPARDNDTRSHFSRPPQTPASPGAIAPLIFHTTIAPHLQSRSHSIIDHRG
ncbi:hypothetical protein JOY44_23645 [Phormidium sp. CLA17]|uniref:hypothetical protein n=1 Tax=Leptolyngbya sp. Cla-17 TaxID=2803751 RepID=UPI001491021E|nr:hypothetical protein [Leptolyngbya sp. Cla-17]MBM0744565.1 hypothetical protein [Leptolyngbya sp. Cla-17]